MSAVAKFIAIILFFSSAKVFVPISGDKILFLPSNIDSHVLYLSRLAADLAELGHTTTVVAPSNARVPDFTGNIFSGKFSYLKYAFNGPRCSPSDCQSECDALEKDHDLMRQISYGGFQFAVMDHHAAYCFCTIPYSLGIPYGKFSTSSYSSIYLYWISKMSFVQQVQVQLFVDEDELQREKRTYKVSDGLPVDTGQLMQETSLWFFLEHFAVSYVHPQLLNAVIVGDIMARRRGKALPLELEKFMSSTKAIILVSLGNNIPRNVLWMLCDAFDEFESYVGVVWRMEETEICSDKENVRLMPWIPQNDLLADHRVEMFISSGSFNSIVESVYHAKPLIIFPNSSDQWLNAAAAKSKGFAIIIDPKSVVHKGDIRNNIINLLQVPDYKRATLRASAILRDQRDTPAQRVSAMIDHVIKYGDKHLQSEVIMLTHDDLLLFVEVIIVTMMCVSMLLSCICCCSCYWLFVKCVNTCKKNLKIE